MISNPVNSSGSPVVLDEQYPNPVKNNKQAKLSELSILERVYCEGSVQFLTEVTSWYGPDQNWTWIYLVICRDMMMIELWRILKER